MGKRGPRKKLTAFEMLEGNPGKKIIRALGIEALGEPFIAEHLMDDARGCIEVIKRSMPLKVYSALDSFLLAAFGMAWAAHKRASIEISNPKFEWVTVRSNGSPCVSPWFKLLDKQAIMMASIGDRLGLDPKSRNAMQLPKAQQQQSKFAGLIGQSKSSTSLNVLPSHLE